MGQTARLGRINKVSTTPALSEEHRRYLQTLRYESVMVSISRWSILLLLILGWEASVRLGWVNGFITSQPTKVWEMILQMERSGDLWRHLGVTVGETLLGFMLGTVGGVLIAIALWWSNFWSRVAEPFIVVANSIPKVALGPIFIVWLGTNVQAILAMAIAISIIVTVMMVFTGFQEVDGNKVKLLRSFGAGKAQVLGKVLLPATVPVILAAVKVNVGLALVGTIVGEFLVGKAGLGFLIVYGGQVFNMSLVMASVILLMVVSTLLYYVVSKAEAWIMRGRSSSTATVW